MKIIDNCVEGFNLILNTIKLKWSQLTPKQKGISKIALGCLTFITWAVTVHKLHQYVKKCSPFDSTEIKTTKVKKILIDK